MADPHMNHRIPPNELEPTLSDPLRQGMALRTATHSSLQNVNTANAAPQARASEGPSMTRKVLGYLKWPLIIAAAYFGGKWLLTLFDQTMDQRANIAFDGAQNFQEAGRALDQPDRMDAPGLAPGNDNAAGLTPPLQPAPLPTDVSPGSIRPVPGRNPLRPNN